MFKNILIIGHSNIGDVCYDLAVIDPLRRNFPRAKVSFLTSPQTESIIWGFEGLDQIFTFDKYRKNKSRFARLRLMAGLAKERFDLVIALKKTLMHKFLGISRSWSVKKYSGKMHVVDTYLEFLRSCGIRTEKPRFGFNLNAKEEEEFCDSFLEKYAGETAKNKLIAILPGAAWSLKSWPIDKWNKLAGILRNKYNIKMINIGKPNSDDFGQRVLKDISPEIISADKTNLRQALALAKRCAIFIGPDSSLLHLASCLGVEVVGLYGPTPSEYFYPYFHRHNIIAPKQKRDCMPCYPGLKFCPCEGRRYYGACMEDISVEDVSEVIKKKLGL